MNDTIGQTHFAFYGTGRELGASEESLIVPPGYYSLMSGSEYNTSSRGGRLARFRAGSVVITRTYRTYHSLAAWHDAVPHEDLLPPVQAISQICEVSADLSSLPLSNFEDEVIPKTLQRYRKGYFDLEATFSGAEIIWRCLHNGEEMGVVRADYD